ncbi:MAG: winged helix-turn-helix domain-containing protein, partial [Gammaproteobacteria bacterium]|nr:winged helix-turn-helix domain-containing protein [Gammaproteobacteria bacterium]
MLTTEELNEGFNLGEWEVLPLQGVLRRGEEEIKPMPKPFAVLMALAKRDGNLITRDELIEEVWEGKAFSDEPIQQAIALLRKHFGDKQPHKYIETLHRRGYRLIQPVDLHHKPDALDAEPATEDSRSLRRWKAVTAVVAIGFVAIAIYALVDTPRSEPPLRSLAILPIENLSGDPANQYIVDGIKNVLAHRLSEIPDFAVKNMRKRYADEPVDVAEQLNVGHILTGIAQLQSGTLKVTYEITRGADGVIIGSGEVSGNLDSLFALQESLAAAVRDKLAGKETPRLITRQEPDSVAYNSYMRGIYRLEHRYETCNLKAAIGLFQESIRLDEAYGPAYLALATAFALVPEMPENCVADLDESQDLAITYLDLAIETTEKGIAADESIRDAAGAIYGYYYHKRKNWIESEAAYQRAIGAAYVDSNSFNWYSRMLASVGRLDDALEMALRAEDIDPDNAVAISRIAIAYTWVGQDQMAREYFRRANELDHASPRYLYAHSFLPIRGQRWEQATDLMATGLDKAGVPTDWVAPYFAGLADPSKRMAAIQALDIAASNGHIPPNAEFCGRAVIGDTDGAMRLALQLEQPGE